jgi:HSP20 family protein
VPGVGVATRTSSELRPLAEADASRPFTNLLRRLTLPFRILTAEIRAFRVILMRTEGGLIVKAYLPGLEKDEVRVEVTSDMLLIDAEPKRRECRPVPVAGRRVIALPEGVDVGSARAEFKDGVLAVALLTPYAKQRKRVAIE